MSNFDQFYDGMETAEVNSGGSRLEQGAYIIQTVTLRERMGFKGPSFIYEGVVVASNNGTPEGSDASLAILLQNKFPKMAQGDVKMVVSACMGLDPETAGPSVGKAQIIAAVAQNQPHRGTYIEVTVTKNAKGFGKWKMRPHMVNGQIKRGPLPTLMGGAAERASAPVATAFVAPPPQQAFFVAPPMAAPPPPPMLATFPPAGWYAHPQMPGHFHDGKTVVTEAELRARV